MEQVNIGTQNDDTSHSQPSPSSRNRPTSTSTTSSIMAIGPGTLSKSDEHYEERSLKLKDLINAASSSSDDDENSADQVLPPPAVGNSPCAEQEEDSDTAGVTATMNNTLHNSSSIFAAATILDDSPTSVASLDSDDNVQSVRRLREQQDTATRHQQQPPRAGLFPSSSSSWRDKPRSPPRVSFYPSIQCRPYISHRDYTHEEYEATWRTETERVEAQDEVLETVRIMRDPVRLYQQHQEQQQQQRAGGTSHDDSDTVRPFLFVDTPTHTSRGIEHMRTKQDVRKRRERKRAVVAAVLYQQHLLRSSNLHDSVSLAQTSHSVSRTSKKMASAVALGDARHSDEVRDGLLKRYASAAMRLSQLDAEALASLDQDSDDEDANDDDSNGDMEDSFASANQGQGDEDDELNRSSALSFEKHDGVVCEELNSLVDDNTTENDKDTTTDANPKTEKDAVVSVISKFEVCVLDAEILAGKISVDISDAKTTGGVEASLGNKKTAVVDRFGNKLLYRQPSTRSRSARQQRSSYHFNRSSGGVVASMA